MQNRKGASHCRASSASPIAGSVAGLALGLALMLGLAHPASGQHGFTFPAALNQNATSDLGTDSTPL